MKDNCLLSVICVTYNHAKYISRCLDGILMQQVDFKYKIFVHDDASSDGTDRIIRSYYYRYSEKIVPLFEKENQFSKNRSILKDIIFPQINSKYVAFCDGDDYWTDPLKLAKQVAFLEKHEDFSLCFHPVREHFESLNKEDVFPNLYTRFNKNILDIRYLLLRNFIPSCSVVYRWQFHRKLKLEDFPNEIMPEDWYIHLMHASFGKIYCMENIMGVYWRHESSVWYESGNCDNWYKFYLLKEISFFENAQRQFNFNYSLMINYLSFLGLKKLKDSDCCICKLLTEKANLRTKSVCYLLLYFYKFVSLFAFGFFHEKLRYKRSLLKKIITLNNF